MSSNPLRAVLFDAAGTLIALREPLGESYARIARQHGLRIGGWGIEEAFHRVFRSAPPMVFPNRPLPEVARCERSWWRERVRATFRAADGTLRFADFDAFFTELWEHFADPQAWRSAAGARDLLRELRARGLRTGVVSNFDLRLPALLEGLDLAPWLDAVVLPAHAAAAKPDPRIFRLALRQLGVAPGEAAYVGDDAALDVAAARAAGLASAIDVRGLATLGALSAQLEAAARETPT